MGKVSLPREKDEPDESFLTFRENGEHHQRKDSSSRTKNLSLTFLLAVFAICMFLVYNKNRHEEVPAHSNMNYNSIQAKDVPARPSNDRSYIKTRQEYLDVRSRCDWKPHSSGVSDIRVTTYEANYEYIGSQDTPSTWCTVQHSENSWLAVIRFNYGKILPGIHYVLEDMDMEQPLDKTKFVLLDFSSFWKAVRETSQSPPNKDLNSYLTAAMMWPMIKNDENSELQPSPYPPVHMHHGFILGDDNYKSNINLSFTADTYCMERDDHCLWTSLPKDHGFAWEYGSDLVIKSYVETMATLQCPKEPFPSSSELILEVAFALTMAPKMIEVNNLNPQNLNMPGGDPSDLKHQDDEHIFFPRLMTVPAGRDIMQWSSLKIPAGRLVPQDVDGFVKMHAHSSHTSAIFLFRALPKDIGLGKGSFQRKVNKYNKRVPILLGDKSLDGNGYTMEEAKAYVLGHVVNGVDASEAINEISVESDSVESQWKSFSSSKSWLISNRNRLMCVWTGPSLVYANCDESSPLSEGFDRRTRMHVPPGGNCNADWEKGETLTWVFFSDKSKVAPSGSHGYFFPVVAFEDP